VLRVLISRRWLGALAAATGFAVAAFFLGQWQWHRYEGKAARADRINAHYSAQPRPLTDVLGPAPMPLSEEWTRVTATGRYAVDRTLLVRNRPYNGTYGYEVLVPFTVTGSGAGSSGGGAGAGPGAGPTVMVDRGWVVNAKTAESAPSVPAAPTRTVTITGWLRRAEPSLGKSLPKGQLASINLGEASQQVASPVLGAYVDLEVERLADGTAPPRPTPLEAPDTDLGPHQAYAFQWWMGMVGGFVLVWFGARREYREGLPDTGEVASGARRPKRTRIWDEEDG
jgi:cytochrome oxidase assembly protein ShyY1